MSWFRRQTRQDALPQHRKHQGLNSHQRRALNSTLAHLERQLFLLARQHARSLARAG